MTDPIPPPSRFAEEPDWYTPDAFRVRMVGLMEHATARERPLIESAATRRYFHECSEDEQTAIRAIAGRTGL